MSQIDVKEENGPHFGVSLEKIVASMMLVISIAYGVLARNISLFPGSEDLAFTAQTLPTGLSIAGSLVAFAMLISPTSGAVTTAGKLRWTNPLILCLLMISFALAIPVAGFLLSCAAFVAVGVIVLGERRWKVIVAVAALVPLCSWLVLSGILGLYLEPGALLPLHR